MNNAKRMVGSTNYEIKETFQVGNTEILYAEDWETDDGMKYFVCTYTRKPPFAYYEECMASDDYLEVMQEFLNRAHRLLSAV